jgi:hypothetical protein
VKTKHYFSTKFCFDISNTCPAPPRRKRPPRSWKGKSRRNWARLGAQTRAIQATPRAAFGRCPPGRGLKILFDLSILRPSPRRRRAICYVFNPRLLLLFLLVLLFLMLRNAPTAPTLPAISPAAASPAATPCLVVRPPALGSAGQLPDPSRRPIAVQLVFRLGIAASLLLVGARYPGVAKLSVACVSQSRCWRSCLNARGIRFGAIYSDFCSK